jgi:hypothetical protein
LDKDEGAVRTQISRALEELRGHLTFDIWQATNYKFTNLSPHQRDPALFN